MWITTERWLVHLGHGYIRGRGLVYVAGDGARGSAHLLRSLGRDTDGSNSSVVESRGPSFVSSRFSQHLPQAVVRLLLEQDGSHRLSGHHEPCGTWTGASCVISLSSARKAKLGLMQVKGKPSRFSEKEMTSPQICCQDTVL